MTDRGRRPLGCALAVLLVAAGLVGHRRITTSTAVSPEQALERFRQAGDPVGSSGGHSPAPPALLPASPGPIQSPSVPAADTSTSASPLATPVAVHMPEPGVYTWQTNGEEEAVGVRRSFPERTQRIIRHTSPSAWSNHHIYSSEHEQRFDASLDGPRVLTSEITTVVSFGPFQKTLRVNFDPPMVFGSVSPTVGSSWEGSWSGKTWGTYRGRTLERRSVVVDGVDVDVWVTALHIVMHGEVEGEQHVTVWAAPAYGMAVREEYELTGKQPGRPGTYHGKWEVTLLSLSPQQ